VSVVPINAEMRSAELIYLIGHSEIGLAVTLPERAADLRAAAAQAGMAFETMGPDDAVPSAKTIAPRAGEAIGADTECGLLYTSGTTGRPKGCILSNAYFLRAGEWYAALDGVCSIRPDSRARHHAAAAEPHERDGVLDHGGAGGGRVPGAARPLPSEEHGSPARAKAARPSCITWA
jgi:acyl-CoA synthetase (AMP-forming)/AMP-acid ligase II